MSEFGKINRVAMTAHGIDVAVLFGIILFQKITGTFDLVPIIFLAIIGFIPVITEIIFWKKNPETGMVKHFVAIGYAVFYVFAMFISSSNMVFAFVIPMILIVVLFNDIRYVIKINAGVCVVNTVFFLTSCKLPLYCLNNSNAAGRACPSFM